MTNFVALMVALTITALIALDVVFYGTEHLLFLARKLFDLIEWLAFWR